MAQKAFFILFCSRPGEIIAFVPILHWFQALGHRQPASIAKIRSASLELDTNLASEGNRIASHYRANTGVNMFAFLPSVSLNVHQISQSRLRQTRFCTALPVPVRRPACQPPARIHTVMKEWAQEKLVVPALKHANTISKLPNLPGIHFEQAPSMDGNDILQIIRGETPVIWVNEMLRHFLGWRLMEDEEWNDDLVDPEWREVYPNGPPDFIGDPNDYSPEIDRPVKHAMQRLSRSVPLEHRQILLEVLKPLGFRGWKIKDLNPNRTRRATAVNWILYWYRVHYPDHQWS